MGSKVKPGLDIAIPPLRRSSQGHDAMTNARLTIDEAQDILCCSQVA
jgi:hypothetical protein